MILTCRHCHAKCRIKEPTTTTAATCGRCKQSFSFADVAKASNVLDSTVAEILGGFTVPGGKRL